MALVDLIVKEIVEEVMSKNSAIKKPYQRNLTQTKNRTTYEIGAMRENKTHHK